ncbi:MAG: hypothetical protein ACLUAR_20040 [Pilosibacter sp.]
MPPVIPLTFEKYAGKYLTECAEETQAPRTLQSTRSAVAEFIDAFGYMALENLTPLYLQEYVNSLLKRKKTGGSGATLSIAPLREKPLYCPPCSLGCPLEPFKHKSNGSRTDQGPDHRIRAARSQVFQPGTGREIPAAA